MPPRNSDRLYGTITKSFHWLVALLILTQIPLGLVAERWPLDTQAQLSTKAQLFSIHKTLGIAIFAVALLRILWALSQPKPAPLHPERRAETLLAETTHWALYAALVVVPASGWITHAATEGFAPILWPLGQTLPLVPRAESWAAVASATHWLFSWVLIGALALHVAGALKHAILDRDGTLARMWFGRPALGTIPAAPEASGTGPAMLVAAFVYVMGGVGVVALTGEDLASAETDPTIAAETGGEWAVEDGTLAITVRQFGSEVEGRFADWTARIDFDPEVTEGPAGSVEVTVTIPSLTLGSVTEQALGPDYFAAGDHPTATFQGEIRPDGEGYLAEGPLSLAGESAEIALPFELTMEGDTARMRSRTSLDRRSFEIGEGTTDPDTLGFNVGLAVDLTARRGGE